MDELRRFCVRMLGDGPAAAAAVAQVGSTGSTGAGDRVDVLSRAVTACRERRAPAPAASAETGPAPAAAASAETGPAPEVDGPGAPTGAAPEVDGPEAPTGAAAEPAPEELAGAVARELAAATARLPGSQSEALALRELIGLPYDELAGVMSVDPEAVPVMLARARIGLRAELRGNPGPAPDCPEHERALRTIALRQDGQAVSAADDDWLIEHLGHCRGCGRAHSSMLEASACYRAWSDE